MPHGERASTGSSPAGDAFWPHDALIAGGIGLAVLILYLRTLYPDVTGGDSGELIGAIAAGGVIHPPGYPLYALLGGLFARLPWGTLAWRFNLLSAVCGAGAAATLALAVARWGRSWWPGIAAAGLFAFAPGVWLYAIGAEVFALNNLIVALLLLLAVLYTEQRDFRIACTGALVAGLGFSNHQTVVFSVVPLAGWVLWVGRRDLFTGRRLLALAGCFGAGLLPYLLLISAGGHAAAVTWGATNSWSGFWTHVLRREYGTFRLSVIGPVQTHPATMARVWFADLRGQLGWIGIALALIGGGAVVRGCWRAPERFGLVALLPPLLAVGVFAILGNMPTGDPLHRDIIARFWQQPDLFCCALAGLGLAVAARSIRWPPLVPIACLSAALLQPLLHFDELDRHDNRLVRSYGAEILRVLPPNTLLLTKGDLITSTVRYLQEAEGQRPDVRVVDQELIAFPWAVPRLRVLHPELTFPGERYEPGAPDSFSLRQLVDANIDRFPIVICGGARDNDPSLAGAYGLWPLGLCDEVRRSAQPVVIGEWITRSEAALPRIDFQGQARPPGSWENVVWGDYWIAREARAVQLMNLAGHDESRRPLLQLAEQLLVGVVAGNPGVDPLVFKHLAMAVGRVGLDTPGQRALAADAWRHYLAGGPKDDPARPAIAREIERLEP